ncbi:MAG: deoxyribonuclease IV [Streptosporangiaceae bacterium]
MVPPVGAHIPVAGGLARVGVRYARDIGAEAVQVFVSNPRQWRPYEGSPAEDEAFRAYVAESGVPAFVHAPYLVNLGSPTPATREASAASVRHALRRAQAIGARGVVVHTGSAVTTKRRELALRQVRGLLLPLLDEIPDHGPDLLLEPMAGQGQALCATAEDLGPYLDALDRHPRLRVCLDTCHAYAAGHDITAPGGVDELLDALDEAAGRRRVALVHANDSKDACGSRRDRHENIGKGHIGTSAFGELLRHPLARGVPFVVETPGKGRAAVHRQDIALLKKLRQPP